MTHTITVTKVADDLHDDVQHTVDGECDRSCQVYYFCGECDGDESITDDMRDDWTADGSFERHGKTHIIMDSGDIGALGVGRCALADHEDLLLLAEALGLGTHDVLVDYWGDGRWEIMGFGPKSEVVYP